MPPGKKSGGRSDKEKHPEDVTAKTRAKISALVF
jgi:hypothetical protein